MKIRLSFLILLFILVLFPVSAFASTWAKTYGGINYDLAQSIRQTSEGGFIIAGIYDGQYSFHGSFRYYKFWVLKLDADGDVTWQKTYGGPNDGQVRSVQQTTDGGFIVTGNFGAGWKDIWVLKLNNTGDVTWQKTYGGSNHEDAYSIHETTDGGFIVAGYTISSGVSSSDIWVLKLDASGNITWQKTYGGSNEDIAYSIQQTSDGGFIVAGYTWTYGGGGYDIWVLKLDADGDVIWQKTYGGSYYDRAYSIQQTSDGGFVVAGYADFLGPRGDDIWVLKLDADGDVIWQKTYGGSDSDTASSIQQTSDGGYIVAGSTSSFGAGSSDFWVLKLNSTGDVTWQKTYGGSYYEDAYSIHETTDGEFIVAGNTGSYGSGHTDIWVLKLNANGNILGCDLIEDTSVVPGNTDVIPASTNIIPADTSATVTNTSVAPINTAATIEEQCFDKKVVHVRPNHGRPFSNLVIKVTSQNLCYDSILTADKLPPKGPFQLIETNDAGDFWTEYGPGDPGYVGGRWWMDTTEPSGEMNEGDMFFHAPLLPPGYECP